MNAISEQKKNDSAVKTLLAPKLVETSKTAEEPKKAASIAEHQINIEKMFVPTAEQRLRSLELFKIVCEKFSFLKDKNDQLEKFIVSSDGTKEKISLSNSNGFSFEISNSQTIEKVLAVIQEDLKTFTARAENEILSFKI